MSVTCQCGESGGEWPAGRGSDRSRVEDWPQHSPTLSGSQQRTPPRPERRSWAEDVWVSGRGWECRAACRTQRDISLMVEKWCPLCVTYLAKLMSIMSSWSVSLESSLTRAAFASVLSSRQSAGLLRSIRRFSSSSGQDLCWSVIEQTVCGPHIVLLALTELFSFSFFSWLLFHVENAKLNAWATVMDAAWAYKVDKLD